jgi:beta-glucosidase
MSLTAPQPALALCGCTRVHRARGGTTEVALEISAERLFWNTTEKQYTVEPGNYEFLIGAASDNIRLRNAFAIKSPGDAP